jgi:hypothetical protein
MTVTAYVPYELDDARSESGALTLMAFELEQLHKARTGVDCSHPKLLKLSASRRCDWGTGGKSVHCPRYVL